MISNALILSFGVSLVCTLILPVVLLIGTDRENCEIVNQRIQARYRQQPVRGVALRHSLQTVETDMPFPNSGIWQPQ